MRAFFQSLLKKNSATHGLSEEREIEVEGVIITTNKTGGKLKGNRYIFDDKSYVVLPEGAIVNVAEGYIFTRQRETQ